MSERDAAAKLALCRWLKNRIAEWEQEARAELGDKVPGEREAAILDGHKIALVTMCEGRRTFDVVDEDGYLTWVMERWPTEIEHVVRVRPAFEAKLKDTALKHGALIDEEGEVCPAVDVGYGVPYPMTKLTPEADEVIERAISAPTWGIVGAIKALEGAADE